MVQAKKGDKVKVHYKGTLDDGQIFDASEGQDPLEFVIGEGNLLPDFENAVLGMSLGETKTIRIEAADAYGEYSQEQRLSVSTSDFPPDFTPELGQRLELQPEDGPSIFVVITEIDDDSVVLDANHPLAGQRLNFEITLKEIA